MTRIWEPGINGRGHGHVPANGSMATPRATPRKLLTAQASKTEAKAPPSSDLDPHFLKKCQCISRDLCPAMKGRVRGHQRSAVPPGAAGRRGELRGRLGGSSCGKAWGGLIRKTPPSLTHLPTPSHIRQLPRDMHLASCPSTAPKPFLSRGLDLPPQNLAMTLGHPQGPRPSCSPGSRGEGVVVGGSGCTCPRHGRHPLLPAGPPPLWCPPPADGRGSGPQGKGELGYETRPWL